MPGKTWYADKDVERKQDHPRVCGENAFFEIERGKVTGSPPRMRGKHGANRIFTLDIGITPAYAGKTSTYTKCSGNT